MHHFRLFFPCFSLPSAGFAPASRHTSAMLLLLMKAHLTLAYSINYQRSLAREVRQSVAKEAHWPSFGRNLAFTARFSLCHVMYGPSPRNHAPHAAISCANSLLRCLSHHLASNSCPRRAVCGRQGPACGLFRAESRVSQNSRTLTCSSLMCEAPRTDASPPGCERARNRFLFRSAAATSCSHAGAQNARKVAIRPLKTRLQGHLRPSKRAARARPRPRRPTEVAPAHVHGGVVVFVARASQHAGTLERSTRCDLRVRRDVRVRRARCQNLARAQRLESGRQLLQLLACPRGCGLRARGGC